MFLLIYALSLVAKPRTLKNLKIKVACDARSKKKLMAVIKTGKVQDYGSLQINGC